ncbi:hypothetical protein F4805DRAFT_412435, partial [Annulohypoxylon moriforme]
MSLHFSILLLICQHGRLTELDYLHVQQTELINLLHFFPTFSARIRSRENISSTSSVLSMPRIASRLQPTDRYPYGWLVVRNIGTIPKHFVLYGEVSL